MLGSSGEDHVDQLPGLAGVAAKNCSLVELNFGLLLLLLFQNPPAVTSSRLNWTVWIPLASALAVPQKSPAVVPQPAFQPLRLYVPAAGKVIADVGAVLSMLKTWPMKLPFAVPAPPSGLPAVSVME